MRVLAIVGLIVFAGVLTVTQHHAGAAPAMTAAAMDEPTPQAAPQANPEQTAKCRKVLDLGFKMDALRSYKGTTDGYGTVVVGAAFTDATFEDKQMVDATVRCVLSDGRAESAGMKYVEYLDPRTHKEVARWSDVTGFAVD